jgi:hypothetical protein
MPNSVVYNPADETDTWFLTCPVHVLTVTRSMVVPHDAPMPLQVYQCQVCLDIEKQALAAFGVANMPKDLRAAQQMRRDEVDTRSEVLIAKGFVFAGKTFSLTVNAQLKWLGLTIGAAGIAYPYVVPTIDGADSLSIPDAATVAQIYAAAMGTVASILGQGTALKNAITKASDVAGVAAVVDPR